jgi:hypothetical protein
MGCTPSNDKNIPSSPPGKAISKEDDQKNKTDGTTQDQEKPKPRVVTALAIEEFIKSKGKPLPQWDNTYLSKC